MLNNLLNIALSVIPSQEVEWHQYKGETVDDAGYSIVEYEEPVPLSGSWQAVDTEDIKDLGLDISKRYQRLYVSADINGVNRGKSPDFIMFNNEKYDVVGDADWYQQNGWKSIICVKVQNEKT